MSQQSTAITPQVEVVQPQHVRGRSRPLHKLNPVDSSINLVGGFWVIASLGTGTIVLVLLLFLGVLSLFSGSSSRQTTAPVNLAIPVIKR